MGFSLVDDDQNYGLITKLIDRFFIDNSFYLYSLFYCRIRRIKSDVIGCMNSDSRKMCDIQNNEFVLRQRTGKQLVVVLVDFFPNPTSASLFIAPCCRSRALLPYDCERVSLTLTMPIIVIITMVI